MVAVLILIVIFSGIALITYVDNTTKAQRRAALPAPDSTTLQALPSSGVATDGGAVESLALRLPEPARTQVWTLLCQITDAQGQVEADSRTTFLLSQTRESYLPDTLRAFLGLTDGARRALAAQGQPAETLLLEQLRLIEDGVHEALRHDHATADRLLSQGRFLRERFGQAERELVLPGRKPS